jgi:hypothetical protein
VVDLAIGHAQLPELARCDQRLLPSGYAIDHLVEFGVFHAQ